MVEKEIFFIKDILIKVSHYEIGLVGENLKLFKHMTGLECGHRFCTHCWGEYLTTKIMEEGVGQTIACAAHGCEILVDDANVMRLVKDSKVKLKYQHLITNSFVEVNVQKRLFFAFLIRTQLTTNGIGKKHIYQVLKPEQLSWMYLFKIYLNTRIFFSFAILDSCYCYKFEFEI